LAKFRPINRLLNLLLPPSIQDWLPQKHLARFVVDVVESLDLSALEQSYRGSGSAAYAPQLLLSLLIYCYATGRFSSRKIEEATYDSLAVRFIACNEHPDHDTLNSFRQRCGDRLKGYFIEVLRLAREMGLSRFGEVSLDGTKIHANASRHSALSYAHAEKIETKLKAEVEELLRLADEANQAPKPEGLNLPEELSLREERLAAIAAAKARIEARAQERFANEQAAYEAKMAARQAREEATGKKPRGRVPTAPTPGPRAEDQVNLTDEESRIMPVVGGGFDQCYNCQAAVDHESMLVVVPFVTQATNDKEQVQPAIEPLQSLPEELRPDTLVADNGYFSEKNVDACHASGIDPLLAPGREAHHPHWSERLSEPEPLPEDPAPTLVEKMKHRLKTREGKALYALRKQTVEPVFGIIKSVMGFRQFSLRGLENVQNEWTLVCLAWNLKRMAALRP
jgi:transposase